MSKVIRIHNQIITSLTSNKAMVAFLLGFLLAFVFTAAANAQETPEEVAAKYGVSFPITELGSCSSVSDCRTFCEDPVNYETCAAYGKDKGFYTEEEVNVEGNEDVLEAAKEELGCDSYDTCKNFCQIPSNFEKCDAFAKKQNIVGGHVEDPKKTEIIQKAKEVLGCSSYSTCAAFCSDETNKQKCSEFAKQAGLRGGERSVGPGGCTSESSCKAFCSLPDNYKVCSGFVQSSGGQFSGPGGCNSEDSCRSYCRSNPQECGAYGSARVSNYPYNPQEMCNKTPSCSWSNNTCVCSGFGTQSAQDAQKTAEYADFCKANPQRCTPGGVGGYESTRDRAEFEKYCRENPEQCRPTYSNYAGGTYYDPAIECSKYQGCSWSGGSCQCSSSYTAPNTSSGSYSGTTSGYGTKEEQEAGCKSGGGTCDWGYGYCYCKYSSSSTTSTGTYSGGTYPSSGAYSSGSTMTREQQESTCRAGGGTCSWNGDTCNCQGYTAPTSGTTSTTTSTSTSTSTYTMSRQQQEDGCRSCGGTCSWNGDFCNCQCGSTSTNTTTTTTTTESTPAPTTTDPATQCAQTSGCSWVNGGCYCGGTQGVSTSRSLWDSIVEWLGF